MTVEKYEREAELIAKRLYHKEWSSVSGKLRREIYEMAMNVVLNRESEEPGIFSFGISRNTEDIGQRQ